MTVKLFQQHTQEEHANALGAYLPDNPMFGGKLRPDSRLRQLLLGLAEQLRVTENNLELYWEQLDINDTVDLIDEWEKAVGIPDTCFFGERSIEIRRRDVLVKLNSSIQTVEDFENLASLLGANVVVRSGSETNTFPAVFPLIFSPEVGTIGDRYIIVVVSLDPPPVFFPLEFPILFPETALTVLKCLFNHLKPANVSVIYQQAI